MKPRVFIGSASESLDVARTVKGELAPEFDVSIWTDEIFRSNKNTLETLLTEAGSFDFGVMILSKDDYTKSRDKIFDSPRDNTLFEFGIFIGRMGEGHAFALSEKGVQSPSDLFGVTIEEYDKDAASGAYNNLSVCVSKISRLMKESLELGWLGMLPSTALAIGYFDNFIKPVAESIASKISVEIDGASRLLRKLYVVMPEDLDADMKERASVYYQSNLLKQIQMSTNHRSRPLFVTTKANSEDYVDAFDLPTTLSGVDKAIDMFLRRGYVGKTERQKLLEDRELNNFRRVLGLLIKENAYARKCVVVISEKDEIPVARRGADPVTRSM